MTPRDPQRVLDRLVARSARGHAAPITDSQRTIAAQDAIETGSQDLGEIDDYA